MKKSRSPTSSSPHSLSERLLCAMSLIYLTGTCPVWSWYCLFWRQKCRLPPLWSVFFRFLNTFLHQRSYCCTDVGFLEFFSPIDFNTAETAVGIWWSYDPSFIIWAPWCKNQIKFFKVIPGSPCWTLIWPNIITVEERKTKGTISF